MEQLHIAGSDTQAVTAVTMAQLMRHLVSDTVSSP